MGGFGDGILGRRGFDGLGLFGGLDGGCGGCGGCDRGCGGDDKRIAVITAVRAIAAKGEGCFDGKW
jgi:hypothetical protein